MNPPLDLSNWIPDELRRRIFDGMVNFIGNQTETLLGKRAGDAVRKLTTDGDFIDKFDAALRQARERFSRDYGPIDPELADAISYDGYFWQSASVHQAIMTIIQKPGAWTETERNIVLQHFEDVFPNKFDHDRVDRAVNYFLRCLAQELWHLPALQHVYELQLQQYTASQLKEVASEIRGLRTDMHQKMALPSQDILELEWGKDSKERQAIVLPVNKELQASLFDAPPSLNHFVDRSRILSILEQYWSDSNIGLVGVIGWGGMGKSSLVRYWIDQLLNSAGAQHEGVFWWSFPSHNSVDELLESLLIYISSKPPRQPPISALAKIQSLAKDLTDRRLVIVLDGIEVMQFEDPHHSYYGRFKSPDLKSFLGLFADLGLHTTKVIITSRIPLLEFVPYPSYRSIDIEALTIDDGIELLQQLGVIGENRTLGDLAAKYGGHPLTLTLLAAYLVGYADGSATRTDELPSPLTDTNRYEAIHRILEHYDRMLAPEERAFMMLLSAFRSSVDQNTLERIFRQPGIYLTEELAKLDLLDFKDLVQRLTRLKLIQHDEIDNCFVVHPLIRDFYRRRLDNSTSMQAETYLMLCKHALGQPVQDELDTLEKIGPRIDAVHYACNAKDYNLAFDIWHNQIQQKRWAIQKQFGALELDIELIELFLPNHNWHAIPYVAELNKQAVIINQLGYILNRLGRTTEAVILLLKAGTLRVASEDWENAACSFFDLAEAKTHLGDLTGALSAAEHSIELARQGPPKRLYSAYACFAWVNFLLGRVGVSKDYFQLCDSLESEIEHNRGSVYLADRVHQATYLIQIGNLDQAKTKINENIQIAKTQRWSDEITSCIRQLGDLETRNGDYGKGLALYSEALEKAKTVGRIDEIVLSLVSRGKMFTELNRRAEAEDDLNSALSISKASQWHLHEVETYIALAYLCIKQEISASKALSLARHALSMARQMGYKWAEADSLELFGLLAQSMGNMSRTQHYLESASKLRNVLIDQGNLPQ